MNIKDLPKHERPREKLIEVGPSNLKTSELLAILFRTGRAGKSAIDLADDLLKKYQLQNFGDMRVSDIKILEGIDSSKACSLLAAIELGKRINLNYESALPVIEQPLEALQHLSEIRNYKREYFIVLYLNARNQLLTKEIISIGTVNRSLVHPREVFAPALELRASSIIVAHNHPSNNAEPSHEDIKITERLSDAGSILAIDLLDHLIVTKRDYSSMKELQLI